MVDSWKVFFMNRGLCHLTFDWGTCKCRKTRLKLFVPSLSSCWTDLHYMTDLLSAEITSISDFWTRILLFSRIVTEYMSYRVMLKKCEYKYNVNPQFRRLEEGTQTRSWSADNLLRRVPHFKGHVEVGGCIVILRKSAANAGNFIELLWHRWGILFSLSLNSMSHWVRRYLTAALITAMLNFSLVKHAMRY